jgi:methanogenic corrinoid protein MtbC1
MTIADLFKQYLEHLFSGKRCEARELIFAAQDRGIPASKLLKSVVWPAMEQTDRLYRDNHLSLIVEHMATRINRTIADQLQGMLARKPKSGKRMIVVCGKGEVDELGAQITADLFEAEGWGVWFVGSGIANDEVLELVGKVQPDILTVYGVQPVDVPAVRKLIELIRDVEPCDNMQVLVAGGVFNRADGLADEIRADLFASNGGEALKIVADHPVRVERPDVPEPGRRRKRKRAVRKETTARAEAVVGG